MKYYFLLFFFINSSKILAMERVGYIDAPHKRYATYKGAEELVLLLERDEKLFPDPKESDIAIISVSHNWNNLYQFFRHYLTSKARHSALEGRVFMHDAIKHLKISQKQENKLFTKSVNKFVKDLILAEKTANMAEFFVVGDDLVLILAFGIILKTDINLVTLRKTYDGVEVKQEFEKQKLLHASNQKKASEEINDLVVKPGSKERKKRFGNIFPRLSKK